MATKVVPYAQHTAASDGEQVPFTAIATGLSPYRLVAELHVQPAAGNTDVISVYDVDSGIVLKDLLPPELNAGSKPVGHLQRFRLTSGSDEDGIDPTKLGVKFAHTGDKWNAFVVVR